MEWDNLIGNIIFVLFGIMAAFFLFGFKDEQETFFTGYNKFIAYIILSAGVINLIVILYKVAKYLLS
jgi:hypothetical protein